MKTIIPCPHCSARTISHAAELKISRSFYFYLAMGTSMHVGCRQCVLPSMFKTLLSNLFFGCWPIFGLFLGPTFIIQNLYAISRSGTDTALNGVFERVGIDARDVRVGPDGYLHAERLFRDGLLTVFVRAAWADGELDSSEITAALAIAAQCLKDDVLPEEIEARIRTNQPPLSELHDLPIDIAVILLRLAIEIIRSDGVVTPSEIGFLNSLADELGCDRDLLNQLLNGEFDSDSASNSPEQYSLADAARILGVGVDASLKEAKAARQRLLLKHHPDRNQSSEEENAAAHQKTVEINNAYELFVRAGRINRESA